MGATYTRQSSYTDGDTITAAHTNDEFNQLLAAFQASSGHTHDGTANEGGPITKLLGTSITIGDATSGTDITVTFDGETNDGVFKWMEDEDYFEFSDDILVASTEKIQFRDTAIYINSSTDGQLDLVADTEIQLAATTVDLNGDLNVSGEVQTANIGFTDGDNAITIADGGTITVVAGASFNDQDITNVGSIALDTITNDGTDITLDSSGDIVLDAGGGDVFFKDDGTTFGSATNTSGNLIIKSGTTTALTFSGADVTVAGDLTVSGDDITMSTNTAGNLLIADGTNFNSVAVGSLSEISTVANDDVFLAVDTSGGGLKKIARSAVVAGLATSAAISNVVEDTSPQLGGDLDTNSANILIDDAHFIADENGNEQIIFQTTSSAVNQFDVTNAATGNPPKLSATGGDSNIDLDIEAKGTGHVTVRGNTNSGAIQFNCENNSHGQIVTAQPHSASVTNTLTLPAGSSSTLVSLVSTDTLTNKTLTSPVINTGTFGTSILPVSADGTTLGSATKEFSDLFLADEATIQFGNDQDVTLTHVADTGLLLSSTDQLQFGDSGTYIHQSADGVLDLVSDTEIEINATTIDMNGALEVSGAITGASTVQGTTITATTAFVPDASDGAALGTSSLEFSDLFLADAAVINLGDDQDVTLTHVADTGILLNSTSQLQFGDSGTYIHQSADGVLDLVSDTEIEINATTIDINGAVDISGNALVSGEVQTANIGFTDGDNAITIADGGGITAANGITSTAASNTFGASSFNDADITNVGSIALDSIASDAGVGTAVTFSAGNVPNTQTAGSQTGNITPDFSQYTNFILTLTGNIVLQDPGDEVAGQSGIFVFIQDGTGSRTLSHADDRYFVAGGTSITLSTGANAIDIVPYFVQADGKIHLGAAQKAFAEA